MPIALPAEAATATPDGNNQSDNNGQRNKQNNILKQQITLSLDLSDHKDDDGDGIGSNSIPATPITPTPTTPNATSSVPAQQQQQHQQQQHLQFEQQQKPIKVQSDKDCTVPYNIINNYFSVGVVSTLHCRHLKKNIPIQQGFYFNLLKLIPF